jgi:hypothetical protein
MRVAPDDAAFLEQVRVHGAIAVAAEIQKDDAPAAGAGVHAGREDEHGRVRRGARCAARAATIDAIIGALVAHGVLLLIACAPPSGRARGLAAQNRRTGETSSDAAQKW